MPLRSGRRRAKAASGELDKICSLLPLLRPLLQPGSLRTVLEALGKGVQRRSQNVTEEGWKRVRHSKPVRVDADQRPPRDKLQQDGRSVRVEHTLAGFHRAKEGVFLASMKEAKVLMEEMHSNGSLAVLAPINVNEKGTEISVLVQDRNGCACRAVSASAGDVPVLYQSTSPIRGCVKDGGTKHSVLSLSKQYTDKTGLRSSRTGTASRSKAMVATQSWCRLKCSTCALRRA